MDKLIAGQLLSILVADLGYRDHPIHGHKHMRHQFAWSLCEKALGDDFDEVLRNICEQADSEEERHGVRATYLSAKECDADKVVCKARDE